MRVEAEPVFILHMRPWRETSALLECLSAAHGRVGLVARGVRRERSRIPRGLLQPLQPLLVGWSGGGELATLTACEAAGSAFALHGERLYSAIYLNELVHRLTVRGDPQPALFRAYRQCLRRLVDGEPEGWTLRRFERDLLAQIGYALALEQEAGGAAAIVPERDYAYFPDQGAFPWNDRSGGVRIGGEALLALAADRRPGSGSLAELRRLMRAVVTHLLGGGALKSWTLGAGNR
ncbi:MAG: DNA repair protein RecO [Xanthomonadales bacterium]|nr:DNA repair protein RecO [Xanthomonadales bacterium]